MDNRLNKKKLRWDRLSWVIAAFAGAIIMIAAVQRKKTREIRETDIHITGLGENKNLISKEEVLKVIERRFGYQLNGIPMEDLDLPEIEKTLESDPFIQNADVYVDNRNKIHLEIEQRKPVLRIIDNNGLNYYLDAQGHKVPVSRHFTSRVTVATGHIPPYSQDFLTLEKSRLKDLHFLNQRILQDPVFAPMIEQISVDTKGEFTLVPKLGDQLIKMGNGEDLDGKFRRLTAFYKEAMNRAGWNTYKTVDVRFKNQVVCVKK
jgi:cell division protein FtsQ